MNRFNHEDAFHLQLLAKYPHLSVETQQQHLFCLSPTARPVGEAIVRDDKSVEGADFFLDWAESYGVKRK